MIIQEELPKKLALAWAALYCAYYEIPLPKETVIEMIEAEINPFPVIERESKFKKFLRFFGIGRRKD